MVMILEGKSNLLQGKTGKSGMSGESKCFYTANKYQGGKAVQALQDQLTNRELVLSWLCVIKEVSYIPANLC